MKLTDQQQKIVDHDYGPARVFAVAGAGKTTAMVHRIRRLVREDIFAASKIMATSFSKATVNELENQLSQWPECQAVKSRTLHQVGNYVVRLAEARGYLPKSSQNPDEAVHKILNLTLSRVHKTGATYKDKVNTLDRQDFLDYVSKWKGNLQYANLKKVALPKIATQAVAPEGFEHYLELYQLYEEIRLANGWITFDDMLMTGWQLLVTYPDLLAQTRRMVDCVLVDEFQDVNLAQFEILDLLTAEHHNLMVIGDDDQTIYEWRGAQARFILSEFDQRYKPATYLITDNFRCKASYLALANRVIAHNKERYTKQLSLTQGFDGATFVHHEETLETLGRNLVTRIRSRLTAGAKPTEIAVLVRVYAQTPYIEQYLIKEQVPYRIAGGVPFYRRSEVLTLLDFCQLADLSQRPAKLSEAEKQEFERVWNNTANPLTRYLSRDLRQKLLEEFLGSKKPFVTLLQKAKATITAKGVLDKLDKLCQILDWLNKVQKVQKADQVLRDLDGLMQYREYLTRNSGFSETGEGKAANVEAFCEYAKGKGKLEDFRQHLALIAQAEPTNVASEQITISTIHGAKGLEWPIVFIPNCNQGIIPFGEQRLDERLEEERRLFYVALTRAKLELHLCILKNREISQFLREANYVQTLEQVTELGKLLATNPSEWQPQDLLTLLKHGKDFGLERYFQHWWKAPHKKQVAGLLQHFYNSAHTQGLAAKLGLASAHIEVWQKLAPKFQSKDLPDFPSLNHLLVKKPTISKPRAKIREVEESRPVFARFEVGNKVSHPKFGKGLVKGVKSETFDDVVTVSFGEVGVKRISAKAGVLSLA